jgi:hypothetical protein
MAYGNDRRDRLMVISNIIFSEDGNYYFKEDDMGDFITLTCNSCGGKLQIAPDIDTFGCTFCGTEYKVRRGDGIVSLAPIADEIRKVSVSTDKTATELAIMRLKEEISKIRGEFEIENSEYKKWKEEEETELEDIKINRRRSYIVIFFIFFLAALIITSISSLILKLETFCSTIFLLAITAIPLLILIAINPFDLFKKNREKIIISSIEQRKKEYEPKKEKSEELIAKKEEEMGRYLAVISK